MKDTSVHTSVTNNVDILLLHHTDRAHSLSHHIMFGDEEGLEAVLQASTIEGSRGLLHHRRHNKVQLGSTTINFVDTIKMGDDDDRHQFLFIDDDSADESGGNNGEDDEGNNEDEYDEDYDDDDDDDARDDDDDDDDDGEVEEDEYGHGEVVVTTDDSPPPRMDDHGGGRDSQLLLNRTSSPPLEDVQTSPDDGATFTGGTAAGGGMGGGRKKDHQAVNIGSELVSAADVCSSKDDGYDDKRTYHPALKAAVYAEGQEAMWHEDECSTVSSMLVKPTEQQQLDGKRTATTGTTSNLAPVPATTAMRPARRSLIPVFLARGRKGAVKATTKDDAVNVQVEKMKKKKKITKKSVVLLPQEGGEKAGMRTLVEANAAQEAAENMIKARKLLNAALVLDDSHPSSLHESEQMAKFAFVHATAARRLMANPDDDFDAMKLDDVLSLLAEKGEHAALQHQKIVFSSSQEEEGKKGGRSNDAILMKPVVVNNHRGKPKKKGVISAASDYASRAVHYLESILPKNIPSSADPHNRRGGGIENALSDDFWSDAGISTLGMKNDTFEYGLSCPLPSLLVGSSGYRTGLQQDLVSLSSLNEILDGPSDEEGDEASGREVKVGRRRSPRIDIPVIEVPQQQHRESSSKKLFSEGDSSPRPNKQNRLLGLVSPKAILNRKSKKQASLKPNKPEAVALVEQKEEGSHARTNDKSTKKGDSKGNSASDQDVHDDQLIQKHDGDSNDQPFRSERFDAPRHDSNIMANSRVIQLESPANQSVGTEMSISIPINVDRYKFVQPPRVLETIESGKEFDSVVSKSSEGNSQNKRISKEDEWDDSVYIRNITDHASKSFAEECGSPSRNGYAPRAQAASPKSFSGEDSDWDDTYNPSVSESTATTHTSRRYQEPVGKTPRREERKLEDRFRTTTKIREKSYQLDEEKNIEVGLIGIERSDDFSEGIQCDVKGKNWRPIVAAHEKRAIVGKKKNLPRALEESQTQSKSALTREENELEKTNETMVLACNSNQPVHEAVSKTKKVNSHDRLKGSEKQRLEHFSGLKETRERSKINQDMEEMTEKSEGSKTRIFGRIVDLLGQIKKPLVPTAIVEETYIVKKTCNIDIHKKADPSNAKLVVQKSHDTCPTKGKHLRLENGNESHVTIESQENINPLKAESIIPGFDDSTVVIEKAMTNGNLKAVQSNEEDTETPPNYLELLLKKKVKEERYRSRNLEEGSRDEKKQLDADSFVEAIRGHRHQEAPGVALEGVAYRNPDRDPVSESDSEVRNLAPTPRRPERDQLQLNDNDPPLNDQRERQRMITERLYGSTKSSDEVPSDPVSGDESQKNKKDFPDLLQTAPTVESVESYDDQGQKGQFALLEEAEKGSAQPSALDDKATKRRSRRLSFLPGRK